MPVTDHPAWAAYKAALARLAEVSARFEEAQSKGVSSEAVEQEFQAALTAYDEARDRVALARGREPGRRMEMDGHQVRIIGLSEGKAGISLPEEHAGKPAV